MRRLTVLSVLVALINACGSGGDVSREPGSYEDFERAAVDLLDELSAYEISAGENLPHSGTASYDGLISLGTQWRTLVGDLALEVDFRSNEVGGVAENFVSDNDVKHSGILRVTGGSINRDANLDPYQQITAILGGVLQVGESYPEYYSVNTLLNGYFLGDDQQGVSGTVTGTVSSRIHDDEAAGGSFAARRR